MELYLVHDVMSPNQIAGLYFSKEEAQGVADDLNKPVPFSLDDSHYVVKPMEVRGDIKVSVVSCHELYEVAGVYSNSETAKEHAQILKDKVTDVRKLTYEIDKVIINKE